MLETHNHPTTEDTRFGTICDTILTSLNGAVYMLRCVIGRHYFELIGWHIAQILRRKLLFFGFERVRPKHPRCWDQNTSQIQILHHFENISEAKSQFERDWHVAFDDRGARWGVLGQYSQPIQHIGRRTQATLLKGERCYMLHFTI